MTYDIIIGIDPDVEASGVATLCPKTKRVEATTMTLPALLDNLRRVRNEYPTLTVAVVVEASWATAHNFHSLPSDSKAVAAKKGYHVGRNHQIGIDIADIARHFSFDVRLQPPCAKSGRAKTAKSPTRRYAPSPATPPSGATRRSVTLCFLRGRQRTSQ